LLLDPLNIFVVNGTGGSSSNTIDALPATVNGTITDGELSTELASSNVVLTATNNISDTATVNVTGAGSLTMNAAHVALAGNYAVSGGLILNLNSTGSTISGNITGTGGLSITGGGLTISRAQTFTGALTATNVNQLILGGTVNSVSSATFTNTVVNLFAYSTYTFGSLITLNNSTLLDNCAACGDTYTSVNTPVMLVGNNTIEISASQYQQGLTFMNGFTGSGNVTMLEYGGYRGLIDVTGNMAGYSGNITATAENAQPFWIQFNSNQGWGTGTLNVTGGNVSVNYNYNTDFRLPYYGCTTAVSEPTAKLIVSGNTSTFTTGANLTIGSLSGVGGGIINLSNATSTLTAGLLNDSSDLFDGVMTGPGSFAKVGTGTQILTGNNNYTGTTLVSAGTLQVGNNGTAGTLGTGAVTDNANLVFDFSSS
jgi:fibronectin-binding autotransporter adhesin